VLLLGGAVLLRPERAGCAELLAACAILLLAGDQAGAVVAAAVAAAVPPSQGAVNVAAAPTKGAVAHQVEVPTQFNATVLAATGAALKHVVALWKAVSAVLPQARVVSAGLTELLCEDELLAPYGHAACFQGCCCCCCHCACMPVEVCVQQKRYERFRSRLKPLALDACSAALAA
jgi:hypothetical protein